jgi:flagellar hook-length control protein FliK
MMMQSILSTNVASTTKESKSSEIKNDKNGAEIPAEETNASAKVFSEIMEELEEEKTENGELSVLMSEKVDEPLSERAEEGGEKIDTDETSAANPILANIESAKKTSTSVSGDPLKEKGKVDAKNRLGTSKFQIETGDLKEFKRDDKLVFEKEGGEKENDFDLQSFNLKGDKSNLASSLLENGIKNQTDNSLVMSSNSNSKMMQLQSLNASEAGSNNRFETQLKTSTNSNLLQQPLELHSKQGSAMLGERILMMFNQGKQEVNIRLDPAELGSMHVKIQMQNDQMQLSVQTQMGQSRDIIEQNLPRLREQLAQQGITLGEANIEQHNSRSGGNNGNKNERNNIANQLGESNELLTNNPETGAQWLPVNQNILPQGVDFYA